MLACGLALVAVVTVSARFNDPDLWWHLKVGEYIWNTHSVPHTDIFSFTAQGHPWLAHEWLAQLSIYTAYRLGGYSGLMLWLCAFASLIFVAVYGLCCLYSGNSRVALLGGLIAWFFATAGLAVRPQVPGYLFLAGALLLLELGRRRHHGWWWLLPPLFAVWVNCHGSYFFGVGVLAAYAISAHINRTWGGLVSEAWDRQSRRLLGLIEALCIAALCVNPVGPRLLLYPLDTLFHQTTNLNSIQEWLPPDPSDCRTLGMLGLLAAVFLLVLVRRAELRLRELLLIVAATFLASQHVRMLFPFGIVIAPILCRLLRSDWSYDEAQDKPFLNAVFITASLIAVVWVFPDTASLRQQVREKSPVQAVEFIRHEGLTGPMVNEYQFGGYLIWALPQEKVFIDGRGDVFDWTGVMDEFGRWALLNDDPSALLNKYGIRLCILSARAPMARVITLLPGWRKAYADSVAVVFVRG